MCYKRVFLKGVGHRFGGGKARPPFLGLGFRDSGL